MEKNDIKSENNDEEEVEQNKSENENIYEEQKTKNKEVEKVIYKEFNKKPYFLIIFKEYNILYSGR